MKKTYERPTLTAVGSFAKKTGQFKAFGAPETFFGRRKSKSIF